MTNEHHYSALLHWQGSTADGYRGYPRGHTVATPPAAEPLRLSADPAFRGDAARQNPEQLIVAAASSCLLLMFLGDAARTGIDVREYRDDAVGTLRGGRIAEIHLRPCIGVAGVDAAHGAAEVERMLRASHEQCYIARSLTSDIVLVPEIEVLA
ncbi:OsmC family protein [Agromyces archimandritae]|uniref:OsmC family protein n=1 Tax=Agromyces archimandritae TaxID=2781962 RepID=A0A975FMQ1_9MICO|nr:OsmC family protein [Agromyces archimandritae]QTX04333.1 OsmC family protein [Agromyces archimandritae]